MRRGNQRNFGGVVMQLSGDDAKLDEALDELEYMTGVEVDDRRDGENGNGVLFLHGRASVRPRIEELAQKHELKVAM